MGLINIKNLTFGHDGGELLFNDVSINIDTSWKLGFCGRNGRGKTTFLNLLMGKFEYKGKINSSVKFDYFPIEIKNKQDFVINIIEEIAPNAEFWQIPRELNKLAINEEILYRPFSTLSNGEQTKTMLAGLFLRENNFLLIDEPTNHLDVGGREIVAKYLKNKGGFILVSHDRAFLDECIDHIININRADIEIIKGNFSTWFMQKELKDNYEILKNEKLVKEIGRLETAVKRTAEFANKAEASKVGIDPNKVDNKMGYRPNQAAKSKKMMAASKSIKTRQMAGIEEKQKLLKNIETQKELKIEHLSHRSKKLIEIKELVISYDKNVVLKDFNLALENGERLVLQGENGSGKSSILKLICGKNTKICIENSKILCPSDIIISYVPQDCSFLKGNLKSFAMEHGICETLFKSILTKLDFCKELFDNDIKTFSAGQKKKVMIAKSLSERAHIYIWDEPLNYIDIISRMQIEELILNYKPTMVLVEHDKTFCKSIATRFVSV